jgi:hypothetical protein
MEKQKRQSMLVTEKVQFISLVAVFLLGTGFGATLVLGWYRPSDRITTIVTIVSFLGLVSAFIVLVYIKRKHR